MRLKNLPFVFQHRYDVLNPAVSFLHKVTLKYQFEYFQTLQHVVGLYAKRGRFFTISGVFTLSVTY
jgi:hypothetical protein